MAGKGLATSAGLALALLLASLLSTSEAAKKVSSAKCGASELAEFAAEYEECHENALRTVGRGNNDGKGDASDGGEPMSAVCSGLNSLIGDCTAILGWCFTAEQVDATRRRQAEITREALQKIFGREAALSCLSEDLDEEEDEEGEDAGSPSSEAAAVSSKTPSSSSAAVSAVLMWTFAAVFTSGIV